MSLPPAGWVAAGSSGQPYWLYPASAGQSANTLAASSALWKSKPRLLSSSRSHYVYNEEVQHAIAALNPGGKPVRILPTALALGWARNLIDHGQFPGVAPGEANFYATLFEDHVHVNPSGCYLVALTWYAALYRESPEGKLLPIGTNLTADQARILQRLAWDVIQNYPDCGLYEAGTTPCGKPEITSDGKSITLKSATSGAWFRYTLDGTIPTRTTGYLYCGTISVQPGIHVKAIAYKSGLADSAVADGQ